MGCTGCNAKQASITPFPFGEIPRFALKRRLPDPDSLLQDLMSFRILDISTTSTPGTCFESGSGACGQLTSCSFTVSVSFRIHYSVINFSDVEEDPSGWQIPVVTIPTLPPQITGLVPPAEVTQDPPGQWVRAPYSDYSFDVEWDGVLTATVEPGCGLDLSIPFVWGDNFIPTATGGEGGGSNDWEVDQVTGTGETQVETGCEECTTAAKIKPGGIGQTDEKNWNPNSIGN